MKQKTYLVLICIMLSISICLLCGCEGATSDTQTKDKVEKSINNNNQIDQGDISNDYLQQHWKDIKKFTTYIGCKAYDIDSNLGEMQYNWFGADNQDFSVSENDFYFNLPIWELNSTCVAINLLGEVSFPSELGGVITEKELKEYFGSDYEYSEKGMDGNGCYIYTLGDLDVIFLKNKDGKILRTEKSVLIKSQNELFDFTTILVDKEQETLNDTSIRSGNKWEYVNKCASLINMPKDKIILNQAYSKSEMPKEYSDWGGSDMADVYATNSGIRVGFEKIDNTTKCSIIFLPINLIFHDNKDTNISMKTLADYLGVEFTWSFYESYQYTINFSDVILYIPSDDQGNVNRDSYVAIKPQY